MPNPNPMNTKFNLIVVIVAQGQATRLMGAAKAAGAKGGTVLRGRGSGVHESSRFLGVPIEPEKDVLLVLIREERTDAVLQAVLDAGRLEEPGNGVAFVLDVAQVAGIVHLGTEQMPAEPPR